MTDKNEQSRVLTLVFTDLADSTALKTQRGDAPVDALITRHRVHVTRLAEECAGRIIDWAGDGCFLTFETSSAGVMFALRLQQVHADDADLPGVRIGIHMGEVTESAAGEGRTDVRGLAVDLASRVCGLAKPGQVLMSAAVHDSARQRIGIEAFGKPVLWQTHGTYALKGFDKAVEISEAGLEGVARLEGPEAGEKGHRIPAQRKTVPKKRLLFGATLIATVAVIVVIVLGLRLIGPADDGISQSPRSSEPPRPNSIAVMYFENLTDPDDTENLEATFASLLTFELSSSESLEILARQRLYDIGKQIGVGPDDDIDRTVATDIATRAQVASMVVGAIAQAGDELRVSCEVIEVSSARILHAFQASGLQTEIFAIAELIGQDLRVFLRQDGAQTSLTDRLTGSVPAFKAYVRGETYLHQGQFFEADREFRRAIELDPDFAQAYFWRAVGQTWLEREDAGPIARRAFELIDRFPPSYRTTVEAAMRYCEGDWREALGLLNEALDTDPNNKEALYFLSEIYFHSQEIRDFRKAVEIMERIRRLDPEFDLVFEHLANCYAILDEEDKFNRLVALGEERDLEGQYIARAGWTALHGRPEEAVDILAAAPQGPTLGYLTRYALGVGRTELALDALEKSQNTSSVSPYGLKLNRALFAQSTGQFNQALGLWEEFAIEWDRLTGPVGGYRGEDIVTSRGSRAALFHLNGETERAQAEAAEAVEAYPNSFVALFYAAYYALENDNTEAANTYYSRAVALSRNAGNPYESYHVDTILASIRVKEGEFAEARDLLIDVLERKPEGESDAIFRDILRRAYVGLGDRQRAANALEDIRPDYWLSTTNVPYIRSLYTLGKLKIELGDPEAGRLYLNQFLTFWGDADWQLDEVDDAKRILEEMSADSP